LPEFIDIHSHALPGFDDGAAKAEETVAIARHALAAGFGAICTTPHMMIGVYEHDRAEQLEAIAALAEPPAEAALGLRLLAGTEYYLDDNFQSLLDSNELYPLHEGKHVLVELPLLRIPPMARDWAFRMRVKGWVPVLAHPERYADLGRKPKRIEELREAGYLVQINLGSLIGLYGREARKAAEWMLKHEVVDFAGSDAHTPGHAERIYTEGVDMLRKTIGEQKLEDLLIHNPREALGLDD